MQTGRKLRWLAGALAAAVLAGCGGGGGSEPPRTAIARVYVAGDSLADVGTFGYKFTVQNSADLATGYPIYPQIIAADFGVTSQCNYYVATSATTFVPNPKAGCTNFAIGNGHIQNTAAQRGDAGEQSIPLQLATMGASVGTWQATDLVVVDGGGNDANDLVQAYLGAGTGPAGQANYQAFLLQLVDAQTLAAAFAQPNGGAVAAGIYMQRLADKYYNAIRDNTLNRGATHVAVLNMPDITLVPGYAAANTAVSNANGGGSNGAQKAAEFKAVVKQWITAFNTQLQSRVNADTRIALVDFYSDINDEVANAASYGLTNVTQAACITALNVSTGPSCTSAALDANPPAGFGAGWWQTWAFADNLHPTPFGQSLLASSVNRTLARAGWL
jgi:outer membrane lipase/esterase